VEAAGVQGRAPTLGFPVNAPLCTLQSGLRLAYCLALVLASQPWGNKSDGRYPISGVASIPPLRRRPEGRRRSAGPVLAGLASAGSARGGKAGATRRIRTALSDGQFECQL